MFDRQTALLLIDVQQAFQDTDYWGKRNNPDAEVICGNLLTYWRKHGAPIFHVRHSSSNPSSPLHSTQVGFNFHPCVQPTNNEKIITKKVNSAFIGTDLAQILVEQDISCLVIAGITTNHCVSTTTRMAGNLGFEVYLVADGCAAFDRIGFNGEHFSAELVHKMSLADLHQEFATVITSDKILISS
ncbi:cysteine hydrolase family protein [Spirabiliibacterium falconis]|uniref:cysteine hydrolase family protein n=1 Tax=Spirabiliibacterium falconis TaxID=572023 RepID=UPI001AADFAA6|nr:cysteine hydrolase family protein [Spirabiliibacterium falconis]MBE2894517.1 cysteine hydrolase [Spirabiliibacterium falconis]